MNTLPFNIKLQVCSLLATGTFTLQSSRNLINTRVVRKGHLGKRERKQQREQLNKEKQYRLRLMREVKRQSKVERRQRSKAAKRAYYDMSRKVHHKLVEEVQRLHKELVKLQGELAKFKPVKSEVGKVRLESADDFFRDIRGKLLYKGLRYGKVHWKFEKQDGHMYFVAKESSAVKFSLSNLAKYLANRRDWELSDVVACISGYEGYNEKWAIALETKVKLYREGKNVEERKVSPIVAAPSKIVGVRAVTGLGGGSFSSEELRKPLFGPENNSAGPVAAYGTIPSMATIGSSLAKAWWTEVKGQTVEGQDVKKNTILLGSGLKPEATMVVGAGTNLGTSISTQNSQAEGVVRRWILKPRFHTYLGMPGFFASLTQVEYEKQTQACKERYEIENDQTGIG